MTVYNNQSMFIGNLGKDPIVEEVKGNTIAKFSLAVYRSGKGEDAQTDWFNVVCWHDTARGVAELQKGDSVIMAGSMVSRSYEKDGVKKYTTEINAMTIGKVLSIKKENERSNTQDICDEDVPF